MIKNWNMHSLSPLIISLGLICGMPINYVMADEYEDFEASLTFSSGTITLGDQLATLNLGDQFRFVGPEDSRRILTEAWGNPDEGSEGILGMVFPNEGGLAIESWGVVVSYEEDGYVSDNDAATIDYDKMAEEIRRDMRLNNPKRVENGYRTMDFIGWAAPPYYDKQSNKLHWAQEIKFGDSRENTLNYDIRVLGRSGVLVLSAIATRSEFESIAPKMELLLSKVSFNPGKRYSDYVPGDRIAEYGLTALVAGTIASKAGIFKWLIALGLAAKKYLIFIVFGMLALVKKFFSKILTERASTSRADNRQ